MKARLCPRPVFWHGSLANHTTSAFPRGKVDAELYDLRKDMKAGFERMQRTMFSAAVANIAALIGAPHL